MINEMSRSTVLGGGGGRGQCGAQCGPSSSMGASCAYALLHGCTEMFKRCFYEWCARVSSSTSIHMLMVQCVVESEFERRSGHSTKRQTERKRVRVSVSVMRDDYAAMRCSHMTQVANNSSIQKTVQDFMLMLRGVESVRQSSSRRAREDESASAREEPEESVEGEGFRGRILVTGGVVGGTPEMNHTTEHTQFQFPISSQHKMPFSSRRCRVPCVKKLSACLSQVATCSLRCRRRFAWRARCASFDSIVVRRWRCLWLFASRVFRLSSSSLASSRVPPPCPSHQNPPHKLQHRLRPTASSSSSSSVKRVRGAWRPSAPFVLVVAVFELERECFCGEGVDFIPHEFARLIGGCRC